jgi:hypothetical protein
MKKITTFLLALVSITMIFTACQTETTSNQTTDKASEDGISVKPNSAVVAPPLKNIDVVFNKMTVQAAQGGELSLDNGTRIIIPANAFVNENGEPVTGEVNIQYREFHNAAEIIASGIPMTNPEGTKFMQTAGMFEMRGTQGEATLEIASDQSIEVKMASFVEDGQTYDFFILDEEKGEWQDKGTAAPQKNAIKLQALKKLPTVPEAPAKPQAPTEEAFKFDFDINYQKFPELRAYEGVIWQYAGTNKATNPENNAWIFSEDWADISLEKASNGQYVIALKGNDKTFKTEVQPVLEGKNLQEAMYEFEQRQTKYKEIKAAREEEQERLANEADLLRSFQVEQFGIYNWDVWKDPARMILSAKFDFGADYNADVNNISVFLVTADKRSVVRYHAGDFDKFSFDPSDNNKLMAVLPGNKIGIFSVEAFKKLDIQTIEKDKAFTFKMSVQSKAVESVDDLGQMLAGL